MGIRTVAPSGILIGKFCKQKCLLIICNTVPIKFTGWATSSMSWLTGNFTAQRPDVILPLFTRVSVLPIKFTPVGTSTVPEIQCQLSTKKGDDFSPPSISCL